MLKWRYEKPDFRMKVGNFEQTPPMGAMSHDQIRQWAERTTRLDAAGEAQ